VPFALSSKPLRFSFGHINYECYLTLAHCNCKPSLKSTVCCYTGWWSDQAVRLIKHNAAMQAAKVRCVQGVPGFKGLYVCLCGHCCLRACHVYVCLCMCVCLSLETPSPLQPVTSPYCGIWSRLEAGLCVLHPFRDRQQSTCTNQFTHASIHTLPSSSPSRASSHHVLQLLAMQPIACAAPLLPHDRISDGASVHHHWTIHVCVCVFVQSATRAAPPPLQHIPTAPADTQAASTISNYLRRYAWHFDEPLFNEPLSWWLLYTQILIYT